MLSRVAADGTNGEFNSCLPNNRFAYSKASTDAFCCLICCFSWKRVAFVAMMGCPVRIADDIMTDCVHGVVPSGCRSAAGAGAGGSASVLEIGMPFFNAC